MEEPTPEEIAITLIDVNPEQARQYISSTHPKLQQAGQLMLDWITEQQTTSNWQEVKLE